MPKKRLNKFRGILEFTAGSEEIVLRDFTVNDLFNLIKLSKNKEAELLDGVMFFMDILHRNYPNDSMGNMEAFLILNYNNFVNSLIVELGWTTRKKLEEHDKENDKEKNGKVSLALFKARMAAEADADTVEDKYITAGYVIMRKFKYTMEELLATKATTFNILLEELEKQAKAEEAASKKGARK